MTQIHPTDSSQVVVIGAGIVGVSTALQLRLRGHQVLLIDRKEPGQETSFGNAGILSRMSALPLNNPQIRSHLLAYASNRSCAFRYDPRYALANASWLMRFLSLAYETSALNRAKTLDALIDRSFTLHSKWIEHCGMSERLRQNGILRIYCSPDAFTHSALERAVWDDFGIRYQVFTADALAELEPGLKAKVHRAVLVEDAASVLEPGMIVQGYAQWFKELGGQIRLAEVKALETTSEHRLNVRLQSGDTLACTCAVLCLGPWSKEVMRTLKMTLPMLWERGTHREFAVLEEQTLLQRPVFDTHAGYVLSPQRDRIRLTTGVHLSHLAKPMRFTQADECEKKIRRYLHLRPGMIGQWSGTRPSFADMLPLIGPSRLKGLWLALGHQHIGFMSGPATGELIAQRISEQTPSISCWRAFEPSRMGL